RNDKGFGECVSDFGRRGKNQAQPPRVEILRRGRGEGASRRHTPPACRPLFFRRPWARVGWVPRLRGRAPRRGPRRRRPPPRRRERLAQLKKDLAGTIDVEIVATDVTATDAPQCSVEAAMKAFGRLDCLVNNAGSFKFGAVDQVDDAALDEAIDISLKAPFRF